MPWNLSLLAAGDKTGGSELSFELACDQKNIHWLHGVKLVMPGAEAGEAELRILVVRMLGHMLIDRMPDTGMLETCESLQELYEYYNVSAPPIEIVPDLPMIHRILPAAEVRPFHITEE